MEFLKSWKDSLEYFLPVKLFKKAFLVWFKTFWWIPLSLVLVYILDFMIPMRFFILSIECINVFNIDLVRFMVYLIFIMFLIFSIFTSVIFSAKNKKNPGVCRHFFYWFLLSLPFILIPFFLMDLLPFFLPYFLASVLRFLIGNGLVVVLAFFAFFLMESKGKEIKVLSSMVKAFKLVWAFYPFCVLIVAISVCMYQALIIWLSIYAFLFTPSFYIDLNLFFILQQIFLLLIFFLTNCILVQFYIKKTKK